MKPSIRTLLLVLVPSLLSTAAGWNKQAAAPQPIQPNSVTDSLRLQITTCEEPYLPLPETPLQVLHRRAGSVIATYNGTAGEDARFLLEIPELMWGDSVYVAIHPPGFPQRDSSHRYRYIGAPTTPSALSVGVWDLGQSIVIGCADGHDFEHGETILCRYRQSMN